MNRNPSHNANRQALLATLSVSGIALFVVCISVVVGGGSATVEYAKDNLSVLLGGTFAFFVVALWIVFKIYSSLLRYFVSIGNIAAESVKRPTSTSDVESADSEPVDTSPTTTVTRVETVVVNPAFKLSFLTALIVSCLAAIVAMVLSLFFGTDSPSLINYFITLLSETAKIIFAIIFGMLICKSLDAFSYRVEQQKPDSGGDKHESDIAETTAT